MVPHGGRTVFLVDWQHFVEQLRSGVIGRQRGPFRLQVVQLGAASFAKQRPERSKGLMLMRLAVALLPARIRH